MKRYSKRIEKLVAVAKKIAKLKKRLDKGERIAGEVITDFICIGCFAFSAGEAETFPGKIDKFGNGKGYGHHRNNCLWNYFVRCPRCGYENLLGKIGPGAERRWMNDRYICGCAMYGD